MVAVALKEINYGTDRVAGIVTPAFLEDLLTRVLCNQFHQDTKLLSMLFKSGGAIGDFGVKTDLAFLVGILSDRARKDLIRIRKIRNTFAHNYVLDTFDRSPVSDWAMALTIPYWYKFEGERKSSDGVKPKTIRVPSDKDMTKLSTPRGRFNVSCKCFVTLLALTESRAPVNPQF
jgi:hypothetical protein